MLGWLHGPGGDPEARNKVLAHLLYLSKRGDAQGDLAVELLILALWPGLCAIRSRLRPCREIETLEADLLSQIATAIRRADPMHVTRVAATLLRNTERDLRRVYQRETRITQHKDEYAEFCQTLDDEADRPEAILATAETTLGDDGVLLVLVHIAGFSQKEASTLVGISHEAARKRCQRALKLLKESGGA